jgi:hypothetical protein
MRISSVNDGVFAGLTRLTLRRSRLIKFQTSHIVDGLFAPEGKARRRCWFEAATPSLTINRERTATNGYKTITQTT